MSETSTTRIGETLTPLPAGQIWEMRDSKGYVIFWKNVGTYSKLEASLVYSHGQQGRTSDWQACQVEYVLCSPDT